MTPKSALPYSWAQSIFPTFAMQEQCTIKRKLPISFYFTTLQISSIDISDRDQQRNI
jgi:hypothetical protein